MAVQKNKAVTKAKSPARKRDQEVTTTEELEAEAQEEEEEEENEEEEEEEEEAEEDEEEEEKEVSEEDRVAAEEEEVTKARRKELKGMYLDALKQVVSSKGLEMGKKGTMIEAVVAFEAQERTAARVQQAKLRAVVVDKKNELEAMPIAELKQLSVTCGIKGNVTKQARVEQIMKLWLDDDGVNKALAKIAADERKEELTAMDKSALRRLCENANVDPYVKQIMVERLVWDEDASGKFARPTIAQEPTEAKELPKKGKKGDMVDALLENEARRSKEQAKQKEQELAATTKLKDLKAKSVDELQKLLSSKGQEAAGKKTDMVEALYRISLQEDAIEAKKASLRAMGLDDLKKLLTSKGLETGKKEPMIDTLLAHEAKLVAAVKAYESRVAEVLTKKKHELEGKTATELKDMCASKHLKLGAGKEDRIERLAEDARTNGEVDDVIAAMARANRMTELLAMDQNETMKLCDAVEIDPLVKEVMIERLMTHEAKFGCASADKPPAKKPRRA